MPVDGTEATMTWSNGAFPKKAAPTANGSVEPPVAPPPTPEQQLIRALVNAAEVIQDFDQSVTDLEERVKEIIGSAVTQTHARPELGRRLQPGPAPRRATASSRRTPSTS
jgi:hypothetical protein